MRLIRQVALEIFADTTSDNEYVMIKQKNTGASNRCRCMNLIHA